MSRHGSFRLLAHRIRHEHLPSVHRFRLRLVHRSRHCVDRLTLVKALAALAKHAQSVPIQAGQQVAQLLAVVVLGFEDHPFTLTPRLLALPVSLSEV